MNASTPPQPIRASTWRWRAVGAVLLAGAAAAVGVAVLNLQGDRHGPQGHPLLQPGPAQDPALVKQGQALAAWGHCAGCHSLPGQAPYAGGKPLRTPWGTVQGGNLTPDPATGLGLWTSEDFWRALHNGRSRNGRLLNPAFPYEHYTHLSRRDSDALYAYLQTQAPVHRPAPPPQLAFPANTQWGLALWRAVNFRPAAQPLIETLQVGAEPPSPPPGAAAPERPDLRRGQALARGIAHCAACHGPRNAWGGLLSTANFSGALLPDGRAHAPALGPQQEAASGHWTVEQMVDYLKSGHSEQGAALGLMAEVVSGSTQHLARRDLRDLAAWLLQSQDAPSPAAQPPVGAAVPAAVMDLGRKAYGEHCAACHGEQGQGLRDGGVTVAPRLAGNTRVTREPATNVIRIVLDGGFGPATGEHPRPFGMPPYTGVLQPEEVAAVVTYIRNSWGQTARPVTPLEVVRLR